MPPLSTSTDDLEMLTRLLIEDVCSDLVRFLHSRGDPALFGGVRIDREWPMGPGRGFADIRVQPENETPYFLEVKYGYESRTVLAHLTRKYGGGEGRETGEDRVVLVLDTADHVDWPGLERAIQAALKPSLRLEVWDEERLRSLFAQCFGQTLPSFDDSELLSIRERMDQGKERLAFGEEPPATYGESILRQNLLWHVGSWRLRELRHTSRQNDARLLFPPGSYEHVVALMADLSGFSRYMHDTSDEAIVRQILTSFYTRARDQVTDAGGVLEQFVGDSVVALFGLPDKRPGYLQDAMHTVSRLLDIAASVSNDWQRRIDHVQSCCGAHCGMAMGRVQVVEMQPLNPSRLAMVGDCLDITERMAALAEPGQVVVSNVLHHALRHSTHVFEALPPTEVRSLGFLQPWRLVMDRERPDREAARPAHPPVKRKDVSTAA